MIRTAGFTVACALVSGWFGWNMFSAKWEVRQVDRQIERVSAEINGIRKEAGDLHGEYEQLNELGRLQGLVEQMLKLRPNQPAQIVALTDLDRKLPPVGPMPELLPSVPAVQATPSPLPVFEAAAPPAQPTPPVVSAATPAVVAAPPVVLAAAPPVARPAPKTAAPASPPQAAPQAAPAPASATASASAGPTKARPELVVAQIVPQPTQTVWRSQSIASSPAAPLASSSSAPQAAAAVTQVAMPLPARSGGSLLGMARTLPNVPSRP
jgi:hypothetical protein